jgi:hypothetical protein
LLKGLESQLCPGELTSLCVCGLLWAYIKTKELWKFVKKKMKVQNGVVEFNTICGDDTDFSWVCWLNYFARVESLSLNRDKIPAQSNKALKDIVSAFPLFS